MKAFKNFKMNVKRGWNKNGQLILAVTAGVSAITAVVLAFRGGEKIVEVKEDYKEKIDQATDDLQNGYITQEDFEKTRKDATIEKVKGFTVYYGPAIAFVTVSIVSTAFGYKISIGKQAAALAALKIAESKRGELEAKAKEIVGEKKFEEIKSSIIKDRLDSTEIPNDVHPTEDGYEYDENNELIKKVYDQPCQLVCDGATFMGNPLKVEKAFLILSKRCGIENYVTVNDLKDALKEAKCYGEDLRHTINDENVGWITDDLNQGMLEYKSRPIQSDRLGGCQILTIETLKEPAAIGWK